MLPLCIFVLVLCLGVRAGALDPIDQCAHDTCEKSKTSPEPNDFMEVLKQLNFDTDTCLFTDPDVDIPDKTDNCADPAENEVVLVCTDDSNKALGCYRKIIDVSKGCDFIASKYVDFFNEVIKQCFGDGKRKRRSLYGFSAV